MDFSPRLASWITESILFEHYFFEPGPISPLPPHSHQAIQICVNTGSGGTYQYRRSAQTFGPLSLTIINSGEAHAPGFKGQFNVPASFRVLYLEPMQLQKIAKDVKNESVTEPHFPDLIQSSKSPARGLFMLAHQALQNADSQLQATTWLFFFQVALLQYHVQDRLPEKKWPNNPPGLNKARDYLHSHLGSKITLTELANVACLSEYHFCHAFTKEFGIAPHHYQNQLRVDTARRFLLSGVTVAEVSSKLGFYDNSHFIRHFRRIVGVIPTEYLKSARTYKTGL